MEKYVFETVEDAVKFIKSRKGLKHTLSRINGQWIVKEG